MEIFKEEVGSGNIEDHGELLNNICKIFYTASY